MSAFAQTISVQGTVKDAAGEPIIGASIIEPGTTNGTMTDTDGNYTIQVSSQGKITISFIGYLAQTINVSGRSRIDIVLEEDNKVLEEVVVIGYGTQRREAVTGSVATLGGDVMREVPAGNITQAMAGRVAGVQMTQSSSKPGASMQIRIRGTRSLTASNDPLVVLDGIPFAGSLGDIDPSSIKNIDILKDAAATAIYGSRGANGVIIITTKSGMREASAKVTYNGYYGVKNAVKVPMMTGTQANQLKEYLKTAPDGTTGLYASLGPDEASDANTDWQDLFYRTGYVTSHDINVAGGSDKGAYSIGASYYSDQAVVPTSNYTRYSIRANVDLEVAKYFRFGLVSNSNYNVTQGAQVGIEPVLARSPLLNPYNTDGTLKPIGHSSADDVWIYTKKTIEDNRDNWRNDTRAFGSYNTLYGEVKAPWVEGLKYRINVGLNYSTNNNGTFTGVGVNNINPNYPSSASRDNRWTTNWTVENLLTYDRTFAEKHNINVVGLYSAEQTTYSRTNMAARDIPNDQFQYWNLGQAEGTLTIDPKLQDYWQSGLMSYMGRVMYSYDDKYMLSATIRADASSRLAKGHQWHTYPAVSVGWNINKESFMSGIPQINNLKLRMGYGETSNQAIDPYKTLGLLNTRPYNFGDDFVTGYYVSQLPNTELGWEYSKTWNFGLDFLLFNNRLSGTIEYYSQKTDNVLQSVNLPVTSGVDSYTANIGKTQNKGFELTLNGTILDNVNGWTWDAGLNFYINHNKLTELASGARRDEGNMWFVGFPINSIFDYQAIGLWQEGDANMTKYEPNATPGSIKVKYAGEYNADGTPTREIGPDDKQIMSMEPDFQGGFSTRVAYKGFDLNVVGAFQRGGLLISTLYQGNGYFNQLNGRRGQVDVDYWTPENTGAKWPNPYGLRSGDNPKYLNSLGYFDASYLKISTITLGYNFNAKLVKSMGISNLRVYATIQNPFVFFSPYNDESGLDPEPNSSGNDTSFTAANATSVPSRFLVVGTNTPNTRNVLFGLNLTF
jgi:TonB-linked SusC/RagA family outer membrane protein